MQSVRRSFKRPIGQRRYRTLFIIAVEGAKTEPQYFSIFNNNNSIVCIECLKGNGDSSPLQVLRRMENRLKEQNCRPSDQAWLVIDKDQWTDEQILQLFQWTQKSPNHGLALSNPKFEYWLLLHFEDANDITSSRDCSDRLKRHLPGYDKAIDCRKIAGRVSDAIQRAKRKDTPPCLDWPRNTGTTVYRLVDAIIGPNKK